MFRQAAQGEPFAPDQRAELARELLEDPQNPTRMRMTALAQAKLAFVQEVLGTCARFRCKAFASLVRADAPRVDSREHLRKDYVTLFQNLHYFLEGTNPLAQGVVVFDELEKSQSHLLINQMDRYFKRSPYGQSQAELIVPEPFFVHSDLTTGIRLADFLAYILSWGFRTTSMTEPRRAELLPFVDQACALRHRATREINGTMAVHWSFTVLQDLRPRDQQTGPRNQKGNAAFPPQSLRGEVCSRRILFARGRPPLCSKLGSPREHAMVSPASCLLQPGPRAARKPRVPLPHPEVEATMRHQQRHNHAGIMESPEPPPGRDWPQVVYRKVTGSPTRQPFLRSGFQGPRA